MSGNDDGVRVDLWVRERARVVAQYRQARNLVGAAFVAVLLIAAMMVLVPSTRIEGWTSPWMMLLIALNAGLLVAVVLVSQVGRGPVRRRRSRRLGHEDLNGSSWLLSSPSTVVAVGARPRAEPTTMCGGERTEHGATPFAGDLETCAPGPAAELVAPTDGGDTGGGDSGGAGALVTHLRPPDRAL